MSDDVTHIPFTQYLLPDGSRRQMFIPIPDGDGGIRCAVDAILAMGVTFECECLNLGDKAMVSLTVTDEEHGDLFSELCDNDPDDVPRSVTAMIGRAMDAILEDRWPNPEEEEPE